MTICYKNYMKKSTKKVITSISLAFMLMVYYNYDYKYVPEYEIVSNYNLPYYANYRNGKIYIVKDLEEIDYLNLDINDIVIIDQRDLEDANIKIVSSFLINDKKVRNDIIEVLFNYEKEYPSNWERTKESLRLEWFVHNMFYDLNYERHRTNDVDLNNNDEKKFHKIFLNKLFKI